MGYLWFMEHIGKIYGISMVYGTYMENTWKTNIDPKENGGILMGFLMRL